MEVARQNLTELRHAFVGPESGEGVYLSVWAEYDSSRLVLTEIVRQFRVKGDPVAMIPNRETLIVAGSEDEAGLEAMVSMASEGLTKPRPIRGSPCGWKATSGRRGSLVRPTAIHGVRQMRLQSRQGLRRAEGDPGQAPRKDRRERLRGDLQRHAGQKGRVLNYPVWPEGAVAFFPGPTSWYSCGRGTTR